MTHMNTPNRLINEQSPYLLQHAYNPVDWYPWSDEAFELAKKQDKPIFLSIGYSTCHWCHVMARESFEDAEVAAILNKHFISIKVDREERPDIDNLYMAVCQMLTGSGGWPTSIFMTCDQKAFFAGTYFPKDSFRGMKGFKNILNSLIQIWQHERERLYEASDSLFEILNQMDTSSAKQDNTLSDKALEEAFLQYSANFDNINGGSRGAPKFPSPHTIYFLLRYGILFDNKKAIDMAEKTLTSMYKGGIYDHIGFGFCRYSTDARWLVPHFEKMLYDNALLLIAYAEAYQYTKKDLYKTVCGQIIDFINREMTSPENGFYTAIDADSDGKEGKFYIWTKDEIIDVLGEDEGAEFCSAYNITEAGNFEGKNIPNLIDSGKTYMETAVIKLRKARENRIKPFKDDKILTSQNGMMIAALAFSGRIFENRDYIHLAENAIKFIEKNMFTQDFRLLARYRNGEAGIPGFADDYVYMIWALIECYQSTSNKKYLILAQRLNVEILQLFWDEKNGGVFLSGSDAEKLVIRVKDYYDGAVPSSNSVCAHNVIKLSRLTGYSELEGKAREIINNTAHLAPLAKMHVLNAVMHLENPIDIKIAGRQSTPRYSELFSEINRKYMPFNTIKYDNDEKNLINDKATVYVCMDSVCKPGANEFNFA